MKDRVPAIQYAGTFFMSFLFGNYCNFSYFCHPKVMKNILTLCLVAALMGMGTISCKEKKKSEDIIVAKYVKEQPKGAIRLPADLRRTDVEWQGCVYTVVTSRVAADSLSVLKDETGQEYVDNYVSVIVSRSDSTIFWKKKFTKESFSAYIDDDFRKNSYLENIIFHSVENNCLKFGVAISRPGSEDEFVPLDMFIDRQQGLRIAQGHLFDVSDEQPKNDSQAE